MTPAVSWTSKAIASCGFLTYLPARCSRQGSLCTGAGLIGTLAGYLTIGGLPLAPLSCAIVLLGALAFSVAVSDYAEQAMGRKDDPRIVIDEWVGYWFSMALLPHTLPVMIAAFILFRVFDVWKPLGIRRLSALPGGWGVVMDDIAAGVVVNLLLQTALWMHLF